MLNLNRIKRDILNNFQEKGKQEIKVYNKEDAHNGN